MRRSSVLVMVVGYLLGAPASGRAQETALDTAQARTHAAALGAHHLCAGLWVVGRDHPRSAAAILEQDIAPFPDFQWQRDFEYRVDGEAATVTVWGESVPPRTARYTGSQGCTILPPGADHVFFEPVVVSSALPPAATTPWPMGDRDATGPIPADVHVTALETGLDRAMDRTDQNTRALVVVYKGAIIGERYAPGWTKDTPQISWSMGKSITAALIGVLVQQGRLQLHAPAPVTEWRREGDPRSAIKVSDLLRMSSGLDFVNDGLQGLASYDARNEHMRIYFDALDVFEHAISQPPDVRPNTRWRYRNSDPLTLGRIIRTTVEAHGETYHTFPQRALFDRIGARNFVLETDMYGNFIMTGYDFGSARDWARFGLLHLWNGVWGGERILPEGWVDFISTPAPADPSQGYGGLFWLNRGGRYDRIPLDAFWAAGHMGQITMVIPSRDVVIVRLGPSPGRFGPYLNDTVGDILAAIGS